MVIKHISRTETHATWERKYSCPLVQVYAGARSSLLHVMLVWMARRAMQEAAA